jgi:hypothetical protein
MGDAAEIIKSVHELFKGSDVPIQVDERRLGMAYAVPRGTEDTVVESYGPWHEAELTQTFGAESTPFGTTLVDMDVIVTWRYSDARQYIVDVYVDKRIRALAPTVDLAITARVSRPQLYDSNLEAYEIPFRIEISYRPLGTVTNAVLTGVVRADGSGMLRVHN